MPAWRVQAEWTGLAGSPYLSTFHLADEISTTAQDAADAVMAFLDGLSFYVAGGLQVSTLAEVARLQTPSTVLSYVPVTTDTALGSATGEALPHATQGLIKWQTATLVGNRRIQGRTFLPGPTEAQNTAAGRPSSEYISAQTALISPLREAGLLIASRTADVFAPVTSGVVWDQWAVLRSRRD